MVQLEYCSNNNNNKGKLNHLNIIHKISEKNDGEVHRGTAENSRTGHCKHTSGSTNVNARNVHSVKQHYMYHNCHHRTAATLHTPEQCFPKIFARTPFDFKNKQRILIFLLTLK